MKDKGPKVADIRIERTLLGCGLVGLVFSALLYAEYQSPGSGVCEVVGGGCNEVRMSAYSSIAGIPVPNLGIAYFLALLTVVVLPALRQVLVPLAAVGAIAGLTFIGLQAFVIGAFCPLCLVVDLSAIAIGALALQTRGTRAPDWSASRAVTVAALAVVALFLAGAGGSTAPTADAGASTSTPVVALPDFVARMQKEAPVTVVEFVDFQCPACRAQYGVFHQVLDTVDYDVTFAFVQAPLEMHEHAADAARAYLCAVEQEAGPSMAHALFTSAALTPAAIRDIAGGLSLDLGAFGRCLLSQQTADRLAMDNERARQVGLHSLPTFWIGNQKFVGVTEPEVILRALDRVAHRSGVSD